MTIRLSLKLAAKVKVKTLVELPLSSDPLRDWSLQMFEFDRKQHVIFSNTQTLYSAVFLAGRISTPHALTIAGLQAIGDQLEGDLLLDAYQQNSVAESSPVAYAKSLNRAVTGSMNELILRATYALADGESMHMVAADINRMLLSALRGPRGEKYGTPYEAMTRLLKGE